MSVLKFSKPRWQWPKMPNNGFIEAILIITIMGVIINSIVTCNKNKEPLFGSEENPIEYKAPTETVTNVNVIDVKTGQDLQGNPVFFLILQQADRKFKEYTFVVEATPTQAYKYLGDKIRIYVIERNGKDTTARTFVPSSDWWIDSVYQQPYGHNE